MPEETAHGSTSETNGKGRVSFSDVARAHFDWDRGNGDAARGKFESKLAAFETDAGEIVDAYWCRKDASAVALTRRDPVRPAGLRRALPHQHDPEYRLYRVSDWVTAGTREIPDLLHECDILAIKAAHALEGTPRAVVMQWLIAVETHVLGFIERHRESPPEDAEVSSFAARERAELRKIEDYYQRAGEKRGRLHYTEGMLGLGVALLLVAALATAAALALFGVLDLGSRGVREFYACGAAGGMGAVVSVLMRMAGRRGGFVIDHELGRLGVTMLGAYRPLVGSVSGIVVYFLVQTTLVPIDPFARSFAFYVVVAFLAGFSERWTKVVMSGAMRTIADDQPEAARDRASIGALERRDGVTYRPELPPAALPPRSLPKRRQRALAVPVLAGPSCRTQLGWTVVVGGESLAGVG
jgi:hypothetical protein